MELTNQLVLGYGLQDKMTMHSPRKATEQELTEFHDADYISFLRRYVGRTKFGSGTGTHGRVNNC